MSNLHTPAEIGQLEAVAQHQSDCTHFLRGHNAAGWVNNRPTLGSRRIDTSVHVFDTDIDDTPVALALESGGFRLHNYLTASEARVLAAALLMAAGRADELALQHIISTALAAAEVTA